MYSRANNRYGAHAALQGTERDNTRSAIGKSTLVHEAFGVLPEASQRGAPRVRDSVQNEFGTSNSAGPVATQAAASAPRGNEAAPVRALGTVSFSKVDAATTPLGVGPRIAPRRGTKVNVQVTGGAAAQPVLLSFVGVGAGGNATLDGKASKQLAASGTVTVRGTQQTEPGHAGTLAIVATVGGAEIGRSNAFTICAIPTKVSASFAGLITGEERGIRMRLTNNSDSGSIADLDQVQISEVVEYSGWCFGELEPANSSYLPANQNPHGVDSHGMNAEVIRRAVLNPRSRICSAPSPAMGAYQGFKFKDARSGATDIPIEFSGYRILRAAEREGNEVFVNTTMYAQTVIAQRMAFVAGHGDVFHRQKV